ncbi:MAG: hypothetical protein H0W21_10460 [Actinobacteria bacterium]|nr:hypothetical protein [Actinomycetota bacterium]
MPRFFRLLVDKDSLTDELFEFVTDHTPWRNRRPVVEELNDFAPGVVYVMENMILDGVVEKRYVKEYVDAVFDGSEVTNVYMT